MTAIFVASSQTSVPDLPGGLSGYAGHFIGYVLLSALAVRGFSGAAWSGVSWRSAALGVALSAAYGLSDEWHQSFVPDRFMDPRDWFVDVLGSVAGALGVLAAASLVRRRRRTRGV
jgi:VanZ family protein